MGVVLSNNCLKCVNVADVTCTRIEIWSITVILYLTHFKGTVDYVKREEEGKKDWRWHNKLYRKEEKIEKPDVQSECFRNWNREIDVKTEIFFYVKKFQSTNQTWDLSVLSWALYPNTTTVAENFASWNNPVLNKLSGKKFKVLLALHSNG